MNRKILPWAFAISGFTALVYEIVWSRPLQTIFGSTIYAISTILTTFFIGFALGSFAFRNISEKYKNPEKLFGLIQIGIGIYGFIILYLFEIITPVYLALSLPILQFILLFFILIIPSTLFGGIWPVINKSYVGKDKIGKDSGKLYSYNSLGSFIGPLAAGFILIPFLGITKTAIFAALINFLVGILFIVKGGKNE